MRRSRADRYKYGAGAAKSRRGALEQQVGDGVGDGDGDGGTRVRSTQTGMHQMRYRQLTVGWLAPTPVARRPPDSGTDQTLRTDECPMCVGDWVSG